LNNAARIVQDAEKLINDKRTLGYEILRAIAEEEIAKFFILLDAVRCDKKSQNFVKQLAKFYDHLAKGIYAEAYTLNFATFSELREYAEEKRKDFYLDGFEGIEYIFPNSILSDREQKMYVDYAKIDDGSHIWLYPKEPFLEWASPFETLSLAKAFFDSGSTSPESLELIANKWRTIQPKDKTHIQEIKEWNIETLEELAKKQLLKKQSDEVFFKL